MLAPWAALAGVVIWALVYGVTRISSLGSLAGTAVCVVGTFVPTGRRSPLVVGGVVVGALIFLRHRENIRRMLRGEEKKMRV